MKMRSYESPNTAGSRYGLQSPTGCIILITLWLLFFFAQMRILR